MDPVSAAYSLSRRRFGLLALSIPASQPATPRLLPAAEVEKFLAEAKVLSSRPIGIGVAHTQRLTLSDGDLTHDAHFQSIDESRQSYETRRGTEVQFRDSWKYNVAAYRLDRLLGLHMVPPSIPRAYAGSSGAFTWWISGAIMEFDRQKRRIQPPDGRFNNQMLALRVFDQLICNTDRTTQNVLITPDWKLWLIDHTRAFRTSTTLREPKNLVACDRSLFAALASLDPAALKTAMAGFLTSLEIEGLLKRRDRIVAIFEDMRAASGEARILYDLVPRRPEYPVGRPPIPWPEP